MEYQPNPDNKNIDQNNDSPESRLHLVPDHDMTYEKNIEVNEAGEQLRPILKSQEAPVGHFNMDPSISELNSELSTIDTQSELILGLSYIDRKPRKADGRRENDAEHTLMLGMLAQGFAQRHRPDLDDVKVRTMCDLHDKIEIYTGDVATYSISDEDLEAKKRAEAEAMPSLMSRLTEVHQAVLTEYELQISKEARFVRMFDKIMPYLVDFQGQGARVLVEDYGVESIEDYESNDERYAQNLKKEYQEPELNILHMIRQHFSDLVKQQLALHFEMQEIEKQKVELQRLIDTQGDGSYVPEWEYRDDIEMSEGIRIKEEAQED